MRSSCSQFPPSMLSNFPSLTLSCTLLPSKSPRHAAPVPAPEIPRDASNSAICHLQGFADIFNQHLIGSQVQTIFTPLAKTLLILKAYPGVWFVWIIVLREVHTGFEERQQKQELCFHLKAFCLCMVHGVYSAMWLLRQTDIKEYMWWSPIIAVSRLKANM